MARWQASSVHETLQGERRNDGGNLLRRHRRDDDLLQGRRQPRRRVRPSKRRVRASLPDRLQHGSQDRNVSWRHETRICFNSGDFPW